MAEALDICKAVYDTEEKLMFKTRNAWAKWLFLANFCVGVVLSIATIWTSNQLNEFYAVILMYLKIFSISEGSPKVLILGFVPCILVALAGITIFTILLVLLSVPTCKKPSITVKVILCLALGSSLIGSIGVLFVDLVVGLVILFAAMLGTAFFVFYRRNIPKASFFLRFSLDFLMKFKDIFIFAVGMVLTCLFACCIFMYAYNCLLTNTIDQGDHLFILQSEYFTFCCNWTLALGYFYFSSIASNLMSFYVYSVNRKIGYTPLMVAIRRCSTYSLGSIAFAALLPPVALLVKNVFVYHVPSLFALGMAYYVVFFLVVLVAQYSLVIAAIYGGGLLDSIKIFFSLLLKSFGLFISTALIGLSSYAILILISGILTDFINVGVYWLVSGPNPSSMSYVSSVVVGVPMHIVFATCHSIYSTCLLVYMKDARAMESHNHPLYDSLMNGVSSK